MAFKAQPHIWSNHLVCFSRMECFGDLLILAIIIIRMQLSIEYWGHDILQCHKTTHPNKSPCLSAFWPKYGKSLFLLKMWHSLHPKALPEHTD